MYRDKAVFGSLILNGSPSPSFVSLFAVLSIPLLSQGLTVKHKLNLPMFLLNRCDTFVRFRFHVEGNIVGDYKATFIAKPS